MDGFALDFFNFLGALALSIKGKFGKWFTSVNELGERQSGLSSGRFWIQMLNQASAFYFVQLNR